MNMKPRRGNLVWLVEAVFLAGLVAVLRLDRTALIIRYGLISADRLILLARVLWGALFIAVHVGLLLGARRAAAKRAAAPLQLNFAPDQPLEPDAIRAELMRFQAQRPQLAALPEQGASQLDKIRSKKSKMAEILQRNDVALLGQASGALLDAEQTLCRKLVLVINRALLCDPEEKNTRRQDAVYRQHAQAMQVFLMENEEILNRCETLLTETVQYVEEKKAGRDGMDLQIMTDVIRSLTRDGIRLEQ